METKTEKSQEVSLLCVTVDNKLSFQTLIENIYRTTKYNLYALQRVRKYLNADKADIFFAILL